MNRLQEVLARMAEIRPGIEALAAVEGDLDDTQRSDWDALNTEWDELDKERGVLQERSDRLDRIRNTALTARGDGAEAAETTRTEFNVGRTGTEDIYRRDDLNVERVDDGRTYRDRAMRVIEEWNETITPAARERAEKLVANARSSKRDRQIADHIIRASNPTYVDAFYKFLADPHMRTLTDAERNELALVERAINEGSTSAGGAIVPPFLDPTIILTNAGMVNPFRQLATVKTITTQTWKGVTSAGVTAEWTAEAAEMTDASPTFTQPTITPIRADAYVQASFETIEDTNIAGDLAMLFADAKDRLEGTAFAVGTGSTQPFGIVTELQLTTASRTAANTNGSIGLVDLYNLDSNLSPRYRPNAAFAMNKGIINIVRQAVIPSLTNFSPWVDFGGSVPSKAIGYPVYEASGMQGTLSTATASNDDVIVLGDFREGYYIVDRVGMSVAYNPLVIGSNRRPTGEVGWAAFWRVGAATVNAAAFQMLRV